MTTRKTFPSATSRIPAVVLVAAGGLLLAACSHSSSVAASSAPSSAAASSMPSDDSGASSTPSDDTGASSAPSDDTGASSAPSDDSGASSAPSDDSGGGSAPAVGTAQNVDVCAAMPAATASQIVGTTFTSAKSSNTEGVIFECEYAGPGLSLLQVSYTASNGGLAFQSDVSTLTAVGHAPDMISGVGDEAFSEPDPKGNAGSVGASSFGSYGAVFGDTYVRIGGLTYVTADQGKQIAELLHSKL